MIHNAKERIPSCLKEDEQGINNQKNRVFLVLKIFLIMISIGQ